MYCVTLYLSFIRWWCNLNEFPPNLTSNLCPVELGVNPWISTQIEQYFMPGWIGSKSMNFNPIWALISMDLLPIWPGKKYCSNWVEIHGFTPNSTGMKYCSNWVSSLWIYSHFEQYFLPGRIRPVEFQIRPGKKYCSIWVEIHGFTPNSISQAYKCYPSEFTPIFTSISCPVEFDRSNSTGHEILLKMGVNQVEFIGMIPNWPGRHTNVIPVNLHPFLPVFHARLNSTGQGILLKMGTNPVEFIGMIPNSLGMKYYSNWE